MKDKTLSREWRQLTKEEKFFIQNCAEQDIDNSDHKSTSEKLINLGWIDIVNNKFNTSNKYIQLKTQKIPAILNLQALEKQLKDGLTTKEDFLFTLDVFEERIQKMRKEADEIVEKTESCQHSYKPFDVYWNLDLFRAPVYTWTSVCVHCGKSVFEMSHKKNDIPKEFESFSIRENNVY